MAQLDPDMQAAFSSGFRGEIKPHLFSSTMWECYQLGIEFRQRGYLNRAQDVERGRGSTYRFGSRTFKVVYQRGGDWAWGVS